MIGSKHDLISEVVELEDAMVADDSIENLTTRVKMILGWIADDVGAIHQCVEAVNESVKTGATSAGVAILIMESAANIFNATPAWPAISNPAAEEEIESKDHDENDDCYGFYSEDSYPVGQLIDAIRDVMARPELSPETLEQLRVFLFAMERLPLVTPGVRMSLGLRLDQGGESDWREIRIEDETFSLGRGTWIDGDADTETVFEVGLDYRDGDAFQASNFALSFLSCAEDVCREVMVDDSSDEPFDGWSLAKDKRRWSDLPCSFL